MADYMRKTKKELVQIIEQLNETAESGEQAVIAADVESLQKDMEALEKENRALETVNRELKNGQAQLAAVEKKNAALETELAEMRTLHAELSERHTRHAEMARAAEKAENENEMLKIILDGLLLDKGQTAVLLDERYTVMCMSGSLTYYLNAGTNLETLNGRKIFDVIEYNDALILKRTIDKAIVEKKKAKIKHISLKRQYNIYSTFSFKIRPVSFKQHEGVLLKIKEK